MFLEYFTAEGLARDVEEAQGPTDEFNTLVLNVDMRKFLRFKIDAIPEFRSKFEEPFHEVTRYSYGLDNPEEWPMGVEKFQGLKAELDRTRIALLDGMTYPEQPEREVEEQIDWFLGGQTKGRHPKYLMYCYESVAVYIMARVRTGAVVSEMERFEPRAAGPAG